MAFTECLQDTNFPLTPGEMGLLYHLANSGRSCRTAEAIQAYSRATADTRPIRRAGDGGVQPRHDNYAALRDYTNAHPDFASRSRWPTLRLTHSHKSPNGPGQRAHEVFQVRRGRCGLQRSGRVNPTPPRLFEPGRVLWPWNRPADAVLPCESALSSTCSRPRNKLQASLGLGLPWPGRPDGGGLRAFQEAIADKTV